MGSDHNLPIARLVVVYVFDCDNCGRENLVRPIRPELSEDERLQARQDLGIQPWEDGELCMMPEETECFFCGTKYRTVDVRCEDDE